MSLKEILDKGVRIELWKDELWKGEYYFIKLTKTIEEDEYIILNRIIDDFEDIIKLNFIIDNMYYRLINKIENERML